MGRKNWKKYGASRSETYGIFWIVDLEDLDNNKDYIFPAFSSAFMYNIKDKYVLNTSDGVTYTHKKLWKDIPTKLKHNKPFDYYPRGRVILRPYYRGDYVKGDPKRAIVYLNPNINTEEIQEYIINQFNLTEEAGIQRVLFISDGSYHYKCYLDEDKIYPYYD